jgi:hypothetical protein
MNEPPKQRWGCLQWGIVVGVVLLLLSLIIPTLNRIPEMGRQTRTMQNGRSIILVLMQYSKDFGSNYPSELLVDAKSSNQVFRELFKEDLLTDERVFECTASIFNADKNIGSAPSFEKALMPGECHWMLLKQQSLSSHPKMPLIIENSLNADWPPKWDVTTPEGLRKRGQAWPGRKIIIGRNDGSVAMEKLREDGTLDWYSPPNLDEHGKSWIDSLTPEEIAKLEYWDIEEK